MASPDDYKKQAIIRRNGRPPPPPPPKEPPKKPYWKRNVFAAVVGMSLFVGGGIIENQTGVLDKAFGGTTTVVAPPVSFEDPENVLVTSIDPPPMATSVSRERGCLGQIRARFPGRDVTQVASRQLSYDAAHTLRDYLFTLRLTNPNQPMAIRCRVNERTGAILLGGWPMNPVD